MYQVSNEPPKHVMEFSFGADFTLPGLRAAQRVAAVANFSLRNSPINSHRFETELINYLKVRHPKIQLLNMQSSMYKVKLAAKIHDIDVTRENEFITSSFSKKTVLTFIIRLLLPIL